MTLTKADLKDSIHNKTGLPMNRSARLVESLLELMKGTLGNGEDLLISGFGKFCIKRKRKRRGRNPQTGKDLMLDSRKVIIFRCSGVLRDKMNGEADSFD